VSATGTITVSPVIANNTTVVQRKLFVLLAQLLQELHQQEEVVVMFIYGKRYTTSATSGFVVLGTSNGAGYTAGVLTASTWYRRAVSSGGCTSHLLKSYG
jgi:hypothetical protein